MRFLLSTINLASIATSDDSPLARLQRLASTYAGTKMDTYFEPDSHAMHPAHSDSPDTSTTASLPNRSMVIRILLLRRLMLVCGAIWMNIWSSGS